MPVKRFKGSKAKSDQIFSLIIRSRRECEKCGVTCPCDTAPKRHTTGCPLQTSHIMSRRYSATRTLETNAQSLCAKCHRYFTDNPIEFGKWIAESIGMEAYESLRVRATEFSGTFDWDEELIRLTAIAEEKGIK